MIIMKHNLLLYDALKIMTLNFIKYHQQRLQNRDLNKFNTTITIMFHVIYVWIDSNGNW